MKKFDNFLLILDIEEIAEVCADLWLIIGNSAKVEEIAEVC